MIRPTDERLSHYDVVIAGARCAGAATALLLAREGLRVLVIDPMRPGSDTLSTHALMRGAVLQLHRWGLLDRIRTAGTPRIRTTTFHYGDESVEVRIKAREGVDALYAPRRTVLDPILLDAARDAGAEVRFGHSLVGLVPDRTGRVRGARINVDGTEYPVSADLVVGADGRHSRVARLVDAPIDQAASHTTASIYGYHRDVGLEGFHWFYRVGASVGTIQTNFEATCVFASVPPERLAAVGGAGIEGLYRTVLAEVSPTLAGRVAGSTRSGGLRAFAGTRGYFRRSVGPGWALVGDAGYFKDPLTAHGITDALRDAELLARAVATGGDGAMRDYQDTRNEVARGLFAVTDRIASFQWDLEEARALHQALSREMNAELELLERFDTPCRATWPLAERP